MSILKSQDIIDIFDGYDPQGEDGYSHFSVIVPLVRTGDDESLRVLYEVRSNKIDRQPGEICFPGGFLEEGEGPLEGGLREMEEETGIPASSVQIITKLPSLFIGGCSQLHAFLGIIDEEDLDEASPSELEVAELFTVPLSWLLENEPELYRCKYIPSPDEDFPTKKVTGKDSYPWRGGFYKIPVYPEYEGHIIWGLTGRITLQFVRDIIKRV